jgi:hypothetical protein
MMCQSSPERETRRSHTPARHPSHSLSIKYIVCSGEYRLSPSAPAQSVRPTPL